MKDVNQLSEKDQKIIGDFNRILADIDDVIPIDWNRQQVSALLGVYLEFYR